MHADKIVVLDKGQIVQLGSHDDLIGEDGFYRQIFEIQTRIDEELSEELEISNRNHSKVT
jgi:ATP-binding cassette subfamily B protein